MRILHVIPAYYPSSYWGGPIFSVYGLNNALASIPEVHLKILTTDSAGPSLSQRLDEKKLDLKSLFPRQEIYFSRRIYRNSVSLAYILKLPPLIHWADAVHITAAYSFTTLPALLFCRIMRKPLVWSPRGAFQDAQKLEFARNKKIKLIWNRVCALINNPDRTIIHVTSEEEKRFSLMSIPDSKVEVVPNGVNIPSDLPSKKFSLSNELRLLFLSRLDKKKGLENLLDAIAKLKDQNLRLDVYGTGDKKYIETLILRARNHGVLDTKVYFRGHVDGLEKEKVFQQADVFILPSYSENYGMVIAEALAHGVPVIASRGTPWQRVVEKGCGLWVGNSSEELAQAIRVITHMDLIRMGVKGWEWMKKDFSWADVANEMFQIYLDITKQKNIV